jgi:hypothetical protein
MITHWHCSRLGVDACRFAPTYDQLDGGAASEALGFPELRQQLIAQVQRPLAPP